MPKLDTDLELETEQAEAVLEAWLGGSVRCAEIERLEGGMLNSVLRLRFDRDPGTAVIKLSRDGADFVREARALRHMRERSFPCPAVYGLDGSGSMLPHGYLLLEALPGVHLGKAALDEADAAVVERELAEVMVALHANTRETYGALGAVGERSWPKAYMPRLRAVRGSQEVETRLSAEVLATVDRAIGACADLLAVESAPTLIHGDIWAANVMVAKRDDGWHLSGVLDPSAEYADAEMELAYLRSFRTPWTHFFDAYTALRPLRPRHELRWLVYWLHTYLIHVYYFGDQHYCDVAGWAARQIVARA